MENKEKLYNVYTKVNGRKTFIGVFNKNDIPELRKIYPRQELYTEELKVIDVENYNDEELYWICRKKWLEDIKREEYRKFFMNCINYIYETYKDYDITCYYLVSFRTPFFDYNVPILLLYIEDLNDVGIGFTFNRNQCTYGKGGKFMGFNKKDYFHINVSNFDDFKAILNKHFNILV